jgi:hypothetical protein
MLALRRDFAVVVGLVSYGANLAEPYRLMGTYFGRILKGERRRSAGDRSSLPPNETRSGSPCPRQYPLRSILVESPRACPHTLLPIRYVESNHRHRPLLRTRGERPRCGRAAKQRDELAPFHVLPLPRIGPYHIVVENAAVCITAKLIVE